MRNFCWDRLSQSIFPSPRFASRLINGGDIGIAEAYLAGDWDTPDLTQFLYLFCVNHDLIQAMLRDKPQKAVDWVKSSTARAKR